MILGTKNVTELPQLHTYLPSMTPVTFVGESVLHPVKTKYLQNVNLLKYFLEDTGFGGNGGEYWAPPPEKKGVRRKSYLICFWQSISQNLYIIPTSILFLHDLHWQWSEKLSELLRKDFFWRRWHLKLNINSFVGGCIPKTFPTLQENVKGFSYFSSFLKLRSLHLTHVLASLRQQVLQ